MTKTFASTLVATELVLAELLGGERAERIRDGIARAADHAEAAIAAAEPRVVDLADALAGAEHLFVVGSGAAHPAALEAALKLKEMAIVHAEGTESWEMASGVATIVDAESVVIALAPHGPGRTATLDVAASRRRLGRPRHRGGTGRPRSRVRTCCRSRRRPRRTTRRSRPSRPSPCSPSRSPAGAATTPTTRTGSSATTARDSGTSSPSRGSRDDAHRAGRRRQRRVHPEPARRLLLVPRAPRRRARAARHRPGPARHGRAHGDAGRRTRSVRSRGSTPTSTGARRSRAPTS